jgi:hypothetical protein
MTFPFTVAGDDVQLQTHTFRDAKGFTAVVRYHIIANGGSQADVRTSVLAILTQLKLLTNAAYQGSSGPLTELGVKQYGTAAAYAVVRQKARCTYQDAAGGLHNINIPAPKLATVFDTDEQTVKPSGISAFNALIVLSALPASGTPAVVTRQGVILPNYMGGFFVARGTKANKLFILDAQLTASEPGD